MSQKTVFISYRRRTGRGFARSIERALTHHGYDVFLDVDSIDSGRWATQILTQVPLRSHFLLLLTPNALDACSNPEDWVRRELELALHSGRNVVPVTEEPFDLAAAREACPQSMLGLFELQMASLRHEAFQRDLEELVERFIPPHAAPSPAASESGSRRVAVSRLPRTTPRLFGRERELAALDAAWANPKTHVVTLVAWGGVGKTSLVAAWTADLAARDYDGADYFDWSFYSQGTRDQGSPSGDAFVDAALRFFGDVATAESPLSPWDKGSRLAHLLAERRTLLVLDGLEPLQHGAGPLAGELQDPAIATLLKGLAQRNPGLCLVTTRVRVADLAAFEASTAPRRPLERLSAPAGVELLKALGVHGAEEDLEGLVAEVKGHALTLNLLGRFLHDAHGGDVRKRDLVRFAEADAEIQGGHAFRVMEAYERWLTVKGEGGERLLAILQLLGLFDRPASAECLEALRRPPAIEALTEAIVGLSPAQWNLSVSRLAKLGLLSPLAPSPGSAGEGWGEGSSLDAHPLVREHFARRLRKGRPEAWKAAHGRLFEHLKDTAEQQPETLAGLQPLYQAVFHGCQAGRWEEACAGVYWDRISRGAEAFVVMKLGAFGADLGAVACFFEPPWSRVSPALSEAAQAWLLNEAAFRLRALGRLREALEPMRANLDLRVAREEWEHAPSSASNLGELELTLGDVAGAVRDAERAVGFADRSGDAFLKMAFRTTLADALHQAGRREEALERFREAEALQAERQPAYPLLYSLQGFRFCDLLLAGAERAAGGRSRQDAGAPSVFAKECLEVERRALKMFEWRVPGDSILDIALDHLTLGRARLFRALLEGSSLEDAKEEIELAVDGLRRSGDLPRLPWGLLTRAWLRWALGDDGGARADLDEALEIAERGPMPLFLADIALHRARFFHDRAALAEARRLVETHGYGRRLEEIGDLDAVADGW